MTCGQGLKELIKVKRLKGKKSKRELEVNDAIRRDKEGGRLCANKLIFNTKAWLLGGHTCFV